MWAALYHQSPQCKRLQPKNQTAQNTATIRKRYFSDTLNL